MTVAYDITTGEKQNCRELLIKHVKENITDPANCFLLPGEFAHDAKLVQDNLNCRISGVERDKRIFDKIEREFRWIHIENLSVQEYINKHTNAGSVKFDFAFLDYLGEYNSDRQQEINGIIRHLMKPKSIIGLTFQKAARQIGKEARDEMVYGNIPFEWTYADTDPTIEWEKEEANTPLNIAMVIQGKLLNILGDKNVDILEANEYKAREKSVPMFFILLRVE